MVNNEAQIVIDSPEKKDSHAQDVDGSDHSDEYENDVASTSPGSVDSDYEGSHDSNDNQTIDSYLDRELDREIEEMIQETQRQLDDELRRQIDDRLQADLDQQMDAHFAELEEALRQRQHREDREGGKLYKELVGLDVTGESGSNKPTVAEINTQIEEIVSRYVSTITLGSSDQAKLGDQR